jgi:hypothetical protein
MNPIARKLFSTLLTLIAFVFFLGSALVAQNPSTNASSNCQVCHNGHTVTIKCDQVNKYLANHPGDTAGACPVVTQQAPQ